jgi:HlyD family secretion protein
MEHEIKPRDPTAATAATRTEESASKRRELVPAPVRTNLPAVLPKSPRKSVRKRWLQGALAVVIVAGGAGGGYNWWWQHSRSLLPAGIASGNGRLESDEIDIDTKFAGRIAEMLADEGDLVKAGQVIARMDTQDLAASLKKAEAQVKGARKAIDEAGDNVAQLTSQMTLATQEIGRTAGLVQKGYQTRELLDQRQQQLDSANAALRAAKARVVEGKHTLEASMQDVELYKVNIADNALVAPKDGRIQYRIANVGEVLPAGGKVFSMLDVSYVYADVYLPTADAGRVKIGADARIVLDAYQNVSIPAKVLFVATQAQFTPKTVETKDERDTLMFRVRIKIDPERLRTRAAKVTSGLPGVAYVLLDQAVAWPPRLQGNTAE